MTLLPISTWRPYPACCRCSVTETRRPISRRRSTRELHKYRIVSKSPVANIDAGKNKIQVFEETVKRVQQTLKQQGIYKGEVDGKFGKSTAAAISAYQKRKKLPETGVPDRRTLLATYQEWK